MINKLNQLALKCYIKTCNALDNAKETLNKDIREFKDDERGISGIVVAILLILIAVALIAIFWENLSEWFDGIWGKITGKAEGVGETNT